MDEELEIFLEDCDDQLQLMENALLELQEDHASQEAIGTIFRAVHTIKGSAGMFGFEDIVRFTHTAENLFDIIRQGDIKVTDAMVELFLQCKDYIDKLIAVLVNDEELDDAEKENGEKLIQELISYTKEPSKEVVVWHISIRFHDEFFKTGMSIESLFNFLNKIGKIQITHPILYNIPRLEKLNPLLTYIGFELLYETDVSKSEIEEVFEFVQDDVSLFIFENAKKENFEALLEFRDEEELKNELIEAQLAKEEFFKKPKPTPKSTPKPISKEAPKKKSSSLRVDSNKIDLLINYMSEIVIANSKILTLVEAEEKADEENSQLYEAASSMKELLEYVRDGIMDIRMVPVGDSFNKFKRIVNDTSKKIGKDVEFVISGGDTELDKTVVEKISDPLVHMLRNSIDHGIELPAQRVAAGKTPQGRVDLRAYPDSGSIVIEIEDNGRGLDKEKILHKAISNGLVHESDKLSDNEIYKLIFAAGLSTADKVSDISGRGVGMDVVKRNIEDLRGSIDIDSTKGLGSKITVRLPLTLAIIDGFLVQVGLTKYIIPLDNIKECIELTEEEQKSMGENEFVDLRGEMLPLLNIRKILNEEESVSKRQNIVIVYFGSKVVGLLVDELLGEYQTVIKSLGEVFDNLPGISGGSILGSGEIALIFDIARLIELKR